MLQQWSDMTKLMTGDDSRNVAQEGFGHTKDTFETLQRIIQRIQNCIMAHLPEKRVLDPSSATLFVAAPGALQEALEKLFTYTTQLAATCHQTPLAQLPLSTLANYQEHFKLLENGLYAWTKATRPGFGEEPWNYAHKELLSTVFQSLATIAQRLIKDCDRLGTQVKKEHKAGSDPALAREKAITKLKSLATCATKKPGDVNVVKTGFVFVDDISQKIATEIASMDELVRFKPHQIPQTEADKLARLTHNAQDITSAFFTLLGQAQRDMASQPGSPAEQAAIATTLATLAKLKEQIKEAQRKTTGRMGEPYWCAETKRVLTELFTTIQRLVDRAYADCTALHQTCVAPYLPKHPKSHATPEGLTKRINYLAGKILQGPYLDLYGSRGACGKLVQKMHEKMLIIIKELHEYLATIESKKQELLLNLLDRVETSYRRLIKILHKIDLISQKTSMQNNPQVPTETMRRALTLLQRSFVSHNQLIEELANTRAGQPEARDARDVLMLFAQQVGALYEQAIGSYSRLYTALQKPDAGTK